MISFDSEGWIRGSGTVCEPSPFFDDRQADTTVNLVVMHNISLPAGVFGLGYVRALFLGHLLQNDIQGFESLRGLKVSSHFFIDRRGLINQFVSIKKRAWHAGRSIFQGKSCCNDFSIGIELEGSDFVPFESVQYEALQKLLEALFKAEPNLAYITGHSDIAPDRKTDPGPYFDWKRVFSEPEIAKQLKYSTIQSINKQ